MPFATLSPSIPHSRSFFRRSGFFSGGEGCEWRAPRATVGESGDKAENEFSGFIPLAVPRKGFNPNIPASRLFVLFHPSNPIHPNTHPTQPHQIKQPLSKIAVNERTVERCEIIRGVNAWIWIKFSKFGAWKNNSLYKI